ncbi:MAG: LPS export ABC transporter permease LptF [Alphaproteobacteria bacterium]
MNEISRYINKQLFVGLLLVTTTLLAIVWLTQSLRFIDFILSKGLSITIFLKLTLLLIPNFLVIILPIALFGVTLFTYNRMMMDREIVVMYAAGISRLDLAKPAILFGFAAMLASLFLSIGYVPKSVKQFRELQWSIRHDVSHIIFQEGEFINIASGVTIYIKEKLADGSLAGIMVNDERNPDVRVTMTAERAMIILGEGNPKISMVNGSRQEVKVSNGQFSIMYFDSYNMDLGFFDENQEIRYIDAKERPLWELLTFKGEENIPERDIKKFIVEGHKRIISPIYNLTFLIIAVAGLLCSKFDRKGQTREVLITSGAMIFVLSLSLALENMATKHLFVIAFMYINALVPIALGLYFLSQNTARIPKREMPDQI